MTTVKLEDSALRHDLANFEDLKPDAQYALIMNCLIADDADLRALAMELVAERATRQSRLRLAIRLHDVFPGRSDLRELRAGELRPLLRTLLETEITDADERRRALTVLDSRFDRHRYDTTDDDNPEMKHNELIVFKRLLDPPNKLVLPAIDEDDGEDDLSESNQSISLDDHTKHAVDRLAPSLGKLHLNDLDPPVRASAPLHDIGKSDARFQAMLAGIAPYEAMMLLNTIVYEYANLIENKKLMPKRSIEAVIRV